MEEKKKIRLSNKLYPYFFGLSGDLLFWIAINTIFLTNVKGLSAFQISSLTTIGTLSSILSYPFVFKIIKKLGNIASIRIGTVLLLVAAVLMTFSNSYIGLSIGHILYYISFFFKSMENVILKKNLTAEFRSDDYMKIQNKGSLIYSLLTMIIAFVSGYIYSFNNYLPMIICIVICIINVFLSFLLYEHSGDNIDSYVISKKIKFTKLVLLILGLYALTGAVIDLGHDNTKLFMQYELSTFLDSNNVAIYLSWIIALSRIARVVGVMFFTRLCSNKTERILTNVGYVLVFAFILIIMGGIYRLELFSVILMALGFFIFLGVRDTFVNCIKTVLLNNCDEALHEKAITYLSLSKTFSKFLISALISLLLLKTSMIYVMVLLLVVCIINIVIIKRIIKMLEV